MRIALRNNRRGVSLIELIISMAILAIVAVALMKSSIIVLQQNVQNEMRDEAVRIAEQRMNEIRSSPGGFDETTSGIGLKAENIELPAVGRTIRNGQVTFRVFKNVESLDANTKQVTVTIEWLFRGQKSNHVVMSIARRYGQ